MDISEFDKLPDYFQEEIKQNFVILFPADRVPE